MALEQYCPVIQIVGYQNSGKTTLVEKIIKRFTSENYHVATIKHHGHGGSLKKNEPLKDSERHLEAGARITTVEGSGELLMHVKEDQWTLDRLIDLHCFFNPDLIVVEGYKQENYPKVVLLRGEEDLPLVERMSNVLCIISWNDITVSESQPIFHISEQGSYLEFIFQKMRVN